MLKTPPRSALVALALIASACSTDDESVTQVEVRETQAPLEEQRAGSLLVEYNPAVSNGVSVHAQFLEVRGVSLEAAFDALDAWMPDRALDEDACSIRVPPPSDGENVRLRMLDVGPIAVAALDHGIALDGRRVPDLRNFSGVVYGNEEGFDFDEAFLPYEPNARYQISAPGGEEAGGFGLSLHAPPVPEFASIADQFTVDEAPIALDGGDLTMTWAAAPESRTALYLDVTRGTQQLQCRIEDDGHFVVPASVLEQFPADRTLRVTLRRVDAIELPLDGVERGSFVFAATDEAAIQR